MGAIIWAMRFLSAFLIATFASRAQVIEGSVVNSVNGAPLNGVLVQIEKSGKPAYQTRTDIQGKFRVEAVEDGEYSASFAKPGFLWLARDAAARRPFRIWGSGSRIRMEVQLTAAGRISGRVLDTDGNSVAKGTVECLLAGGLSGQTVTTDEHGAFSIEQLSPGRYVLSARAPNALNPPSPPESQPLAWVRTFYPGVPFRSGATIIDLQPGADLWGRDINLASVPAYRLRGVVVGEGGQPLANVNVRLVPANEILVRDVESRVTTSKDGSFEFSRLPRGEWRLQSEAVQDGVKLRGRLVETVLDRDIDRVEFRLYSAFSLRGSLYREPSGGLPSEKTPMGISLLPFEGGDDLAFAPADSDGNFNLEIVYPGVYKIRPIPTSPGPPYYLDSIKLGDREVLGQYVEFTSGSLPVRITYRKNGGGIRGSVEEGRGTHVVLISQNPEFRGPEFTYQLRCNEDGRFEFVNLRPGDYYVFAFDQQPPIDLYRRLDQSLLNSATAVHVRSGETTATVLYISAQPTP